MLFDDIQSFFNWHKKLYIHTKNFFIIISSHVMLIWQAMASYKGLLQKLISSCNITKVKEKDGFFMFFQVPLFQNRNVFLSDSPPKLILRKSNLRILCLSHIWEVLSTVMLYKIISWFLNIYFQLQATSFFFLNLFVKG